MYLANLVYSIFMFPVYIFLTDSLTTSYFESNTETNKCASLDNVQYNMQFHIPFAELCECIVVRIDCVVYEVVEVFVRALAQEHYFQVGFSSLEETADTDVKFAVKVRQNIY